MSSSRDDNNSKSTEKDKVKNFDNIFIMDDVADKDMGDMFELMPLRRTEFPKNRINILLYNNLDTMSEETKNKFYAMITKMRFKWYHLNTDPFHCANNMIRLYMKCGKPCPQSEIDKMLDSKTEAPTIPAYIHELSNYEQIEFEGDLSSMDIYHDIYDGKSTNFAGIRLAKKRHIEKRSRDKYTIAKFSHNPTTILHPSRIAISQSPPSICE